MPDTQEIIARLRALPLFTDLSDEDLGIVARLVERESFRRNDLIFRQGDPSDKFYIIESGQVLLSVQDATGARADLTRLGAGDFFGEAGLIRHEVRNATITSVGDTYLYSMTQAKFQQFLHDFPRIRRLLVQRATVRERGAQKRYAWELEDEVAILVERRHMVAAILDDVPQILGFTLLCAAVVFVAVRLLPPSGLTLGLGAFFAVLWLLFMAWHFVDWRNDYFVVTNQRVVHVEQVLFVREARSEAPIEMVQNVVLLQEGLLAKLLNYGDLRIEMANARVVFDHIPNPEGVQQRILQQRMRILSEARAQERDEIRKSIEQALRPAARLPGPPPPPPPAPAAKPARAPNLFQSFVRWLHGVFRLRLERDGQIIWRKHWLILLKQVFKPLVATSLGVLAWVGMEWLGQAAPLFTLLAWLPVPVVVISLGWVIWEYADWENDLYILTPDRIIDIERLPFGLRESRREGGLDRIQDIEVKLPTFLATFFNVGDVRIKTAAAGGDFTFNRVSDPRGVQRDIFHHLARFRRRQQMQERQRRFEELSQWFSVYGEVTGQATQVKQ